ncbi:hypothetical protein [Sphingomicrobium flavum]|uniref:hypothetical protein n=1 Tax=Sphingomicrobium flavum TaxID=1229164 RepID=UPI0021AD719B|nr:hypothetical protein [Sphingomicrobium flavum]
MTRLTRLPLQSGLACLVFAGATPAFAQSSDESGPAVIIEGERIDDYAARRQARDITPGSGQSHEALPRFQKPVCIGVFGLRPENAAPMIERMYDNAEDIGLIVNRGEGCRANVWVLVVDDPAAKFDKLVEEGDDLIAALAKYKRKRIARQDGPVRAWNLTSERDEYGNKVPTGFEAASMMQGAAMGISSMPIVVSSRSSRMRLSVRMDIDLSLVMIAREALADVDAHALADYATMRAFTETEEPEKAVGFESILTLFSDQREVTRLSAFDRGYLRSLYKANAHRPARVGLASLSPHIERELALEAQQPKDE